MHALLMYCRGNDDAHADRQGPDQNRERDILVFDNFFPEMIWSQFVDQYEGDRKDQDTEHLVNQCVRQSMEIHVHLPPIYRE